MKRIPLTTNSLLEYMKHQSMIKKEKDREDKSVINSGGLLEFIKNMEIPKDLPTPDDVWSDMQEMWNKNPYGLLPSIDLNKIGTPLEDKMWEDIFDFNTHPKSFCDVLRLGFRDSGWIW